MRNVLSLLAILLALDAPASAGTVRVAVAANFKATLDALAPAFRGASGHELKISAGSTGLLFAQIRRGAPFDVFLAADRARPARLVALGLAERESLFTYAGGRLAFVARDPGLIPPDSARLRQVRTLAIANPRTAPYGLATLGVIEALGARPRRLAKAQSVAGVTAAVAAGGADAGFTALALVRFRRPPGVYIWPVPVRLHRPIRQDAVLLSRARKNVAARALLAWLRGKTARGTIRAHGYDAD